MNTAYDDVCAYLFEPIGPTNSHDTPPRQVLVVWVAVHFSAALAMVAALVSFASIPGVLIALGWVAFVSPLAALVALNIAGLPARQPLLAAARRWHWISILVWIGMAAMLLSIEGLSVGIFVLVITTMVLGARWGAIDAWAQKARSAGFYLRSITRRAAGKAFGLWTMLNIVGARFTIPSPPETVDLVIFAGVIVAPWIIAFPACITAEVIAVADRIVRADALSTRRTAEVRERRNRSYVQHDLVSPAEIRLRRLIEEPDVAEAAVALAAAHTFSFGQLEPRSLDALVSAAARAGAARVSIEHQDGGGAIVRGDCARLVTRFTAGMVQNAVDAHADQIHLATRIDDTHVHLICSDSGAGFDPTRPLRDGSGIAHLRADLRSYGAELTMDPAPCGSLRTRIPRESTEIRRALPTHATETRFYAAISDEDATFVTDDGGDLLSPPFESVRSLDISFEHRISVVVAEGPAWHSRASALSEEFMPVKTRGIPLAAVVSPGDPLLAVTTATRRGDLLRFLDAKDLHTRSSVALPPLNRFSRPSFDPAGRRVLVPTADGAAVLVRSSTGKLTPLSLPGGATDWWPDTSADRLIRVHLRDRHMEIHSVCIGTGECVLTRRIGIDDVAASTHRVVATRVDSFGSRALVLIRGRSTDSSGPLTMFEIDLTSEEPELSRREREDVRRGANLLDAAWLSCAAPTISTTPEPLATSLLAPYSTEAKPHDRPPRVAPAALFLQRF